MINITGKDSSHTFSVIFKEIVQKNQDTFESLTTLSKAQNTEFFTEMCIEDDKKLVIYNINSDNRPLSVHPQRERRCAVSLATHTHPGVPGLPETGRTRFSSADWQIFTSTLLDPKDKAVIGCVQGVKDRSLKCLINPAKFMREYPPSILEMDAQV